MIMSMSLQNNTSNHLNEPCAEVSLIQMLDARERRFLRQQELLHTWPGNTLVCFTMNIAGPVKNSPLIRRGFLHGCEQIRRQLMRFRKKPVYEILFDELTGNEGYFVIDLPPMEVKRMMADLEDHDGIGRLYDMDVLDAAGTKLDRQELGLEPRTCLLCGRPAKACARSREHTVAQLREKTTSLLQDFFRLRDLQTIAQDACRALLYEVCTTPKPGLVDRNNSGSHTDMDIFTFMDSAAVLQPYFYRCGEIGMDNRTKTPQETFALLRQAGIEAERTMFGATRGVNTHKGAVFSMGLACAALGRLDHAAWSDPAAVLATCGELAAGITGRDYRKLALLAKEAGISPEPGSAETAHMPAAAPSPASAAFSAPPGPEKEPAGPYTPSDKDKESAVTHAPADKDEESAAPYTLSGPETLTAGEKLYLQYGIRGVRGQAEDGFPAVLEAGLPVLNRELAAGADINRAGTVAMLAILCADTDTNLITRGGRQTQLGINARIEALLRDCPSPAEEVIADLDRQFIEKNLSPGGTADLLGLCYLLHFLQTEET